MNRAAITDWLLADVGGTRARLAFLAADGALGPARVTENDRFPDLYALLASALEKHPADRARLGVALAVAAPVTGDAVTMTNRSWDFSIARVERALGVACLRVINDFAAIAWSIPVLGAGHTRANGGTIGSAPEAGPIGVLGPGTGLGVSGLIPCAAGYAALSSEGGHVTLAPDGEEEEAVLARVRRRFGHASAERLVSGPGLVTLYECLATLAGLETQALRPEEVSALACGASDPIAERALALFFGLLGSVAGNLALTLGALGGVYLAGGILPRLAEPLMASSFRERFVAKRRYRRYLEAIPTRLIVHPCPALPGLRSLCERA